jgi:hypothetical protein
MEPKTWTEVFTLAVEHLTRDRLPLSVYDQNLVQDLEIALGKTEAPATTVSRSRLRLAFKYGLISEDTLIEVVLLAQEVARLDEACASAMSRTLQKERGQAIYDLCEQVGALETNDGLG